MKKNIMRILALVVVCALFVAYGKYVRLQTIKSAELVEDNTVEEYQQSNDCGLITVSKE